MCDIKTPSDTLISIITVVRNGMPYFADTVWSVVNQAYKNYEYIVVDGGSTDGTFEFIENSEKISKWISEPDGGIADAFNKGFNLSCGEYILFLNADDALIDSEALKRVSEAILYNPGCDLIYGDCNVVDRQTSRLLYRASIEFEREKFLRGQMFPHPSSFTKRSYFERYGLFDTKFCVAMDYEFFLRGIQEASIFHLPILITKVRDGGISTINKNYVVEEIILALKKNGYLKNFFTEFSLKVYFYLRRCASRFLKIFGAYKKFDELRKKIQKF
jgi:glycosyltransferase involved in cell wall biosynthesis